MNRLCLALCALVALAGCDSVVPPPPDGPVTEGPAVPPPPATQTKTVRAMHIFGVGAPEDATTNPFLAAEADTLRGAVVLNVWGDVETADPCGETGPSCRTVWQGWPLSSRTTLRFSVPIVVNGSVVDAGADLFSFLDEFERASLITPTEQRTWLFAVRLDPARFSVPAGPVTVSMAWGSDNGATFADTTTFVFVPASE